MAEDIIYICREYVKQLFDGSESPWLKYHTFEHTLDVFKGANLLSEKSTINEEQKEILLLAALFHDVGFTKSHINHESKGAEIAEQFLSIHKYPKSKINKVQECITATHISWQGNDHLCNLLKDADLSGLASKKYQKKVEYLRLEINEINESNISKEEWLSTNISFLKNHHYLTNEGIFFFENGKQKNLEKLMKMAEETNKLAKIQSISNSKSAQTQMKTALRNHIDLSAIADNKANIMLTVNALVITVGLPLLLEKLYLNKDYIYVVLTLAASSVMSMIFATLSTRPIKNVGYSTIEQIKNGKSNLFFFGNYYKMKFEDYDKGIKVVIADDENLNDSIIRDLYFLGKSLGYKFDLLRWCYNAFMFGIILVVLEFAFIALK